ncbi:MAG: uroporphyrinogen-III synthase [Mariprofundaceae bacterium]|nr:uroporphyrinogen-III synthase [Mariprofundaceae bacterium]
MNPLSEKRILITRAAEQCPAVATLIEQRGGQGIEFPCLAVQCMPESIRSGLQAAPDDAAMLFSSVNGVCCAAQTLGPVFTNALKGRSVIAVGEHTAAALQNYGAQVTWIARDASQEGLVQGFADHGLPADICFLRAAQGRDLLQQSLEEQGVAVHLVMAYHTICPQNDACDIRQQLENGEVDAVLLGSSRTALHYVQRIRNTSLADRPAIVVISPQVAAAAEDAGLSVQVVAKETSFAGMLDALSAYYETDAGTGPDPAAHHSDQEK